LRLRSARDRANAERDEARVKISALLLKGNTWLEHEIAKDRDRWKVMYDNCFKEFQRVDNQLAEAIRQRDGARFVSANIDTMREQRDEYWKEMQALKAQVSDLAAERDEAKKALDQQAMVLYGQLCQERDEARAELEHRTKQVADQRYSNDLQVKENAALMAQICEMDERCKRLTREREGARKSVAILNQHISPHVNWMLAVQSKGHEIEECGFMDIFKVHDLLDLIAKGPGHSPDQNIYPHTCTEGGERGE